MTNANKTKQCFLELLNPHKDLLYKYGKHIIRNVNDAEDALQTTIMNAYKTLDIFMDNRSRRAFFQGTQGKGWRQIPVIWNTIGKGTAGYHTRYNRCPYTGTYQAGTNNDCKTRCYGCGEISQAEWKPAETWYGIAPWGILQAEDAFIQARRDRIPAIIDYNKAQYTLFVSVGNRPWRRHTSLESLCNPNGCFPDFL